MRTNQRIFSVKIDASTIEELVVVFFIGIIYSDIKLDEELLQTRADLPYLTKSRLLFASILTNNIEILGKGFLTANIVKLNNLHSVYKP